jgi:hypothetical protein
VPNKWAIVKVGHNKGVVDYGFWLLLSFGHCISTDYGFWLPSIFWPLYLYWLRLLITIYLLAIVSLRITASDCYYLLVIRRDTMAKDSSNQKP